MLPARSQRRVAKREDPHGDAEDEADAQLTKEYAAMSQVDSWQGAVIVADAEDEVGAEGNRYAGSEARDL